MYFYNQKSCVELQRYHQESEDNPYREKYVQIMSQYSE